MHKVSNHIYRVLFYSKTKVCHFLQLLRDSWVGGQL